jgi:hypothetical protein
VSGQPQPCSKLGAWKFPPADDRIAPLFSHPAQHRGYFGKSFCSIEHETVQSFTEEGPDTISQTTL